MNPKGSYPETDFGYYSRAQEELGVLPKENYHEEWRPDRGFPTRPGWLNAIFAGQQRLEKGVTLSCPTFVLLSARSTNPIAWDDDMTSSDSVLTVADIAAAATHIHPEVTISRIPGALHDVFISGEPARSKAYASLKDWLLKGNAVQS